jgi:cobalt-zinc-cadmium resistance protein CzcA
VTALINFFLDNRWLALFCAIALAAGGGWALLQVPIDAFPDLTNNQVVIFTESPGMAPGEVEQLVTYPIETSLMGIPRTLQVRSVSKFGLSIVTVVFNDDVYIFTARQLVNERLQEVRGRLPEGLDPHLGPMATVFGELYQYTLEGGNYSLMDRKTIQEFQLKNQLRTVKGVNEVDSSGGLTKQYAVEVDPARAQSYGLTLRDIYERIHENNENFGGGFIEHSSEQYTLRGLGRVKEEKDLEAIVVASRNGTPVYLRDVAKVGLTSAQRQGAVLRDGKGETVCGVVIMLKGENGKQVIERVKEKLNTLRLPPGLKMVKFYDQSEVIDSTIATVRKNLLEGGVLVILTLALFLGNLRASLIVAAVIPLSMLFAFLGMHYFAISANLMSLGAIDFGMIVDGAVVMVENSMRRLSSRETMPVADRIREACHEVAKPVLFAVCIIIAVYLPIFSLEGLEGKLFRPMAITVCAALAGSLLISLFIVPAATATLFRKPLPAHNQRWFEVVLGIYRGALDFTLRHRIATVAVALIAVVSSLASIAWLGTEFMPKLDEGTLLITTKKLPGIALSDSVRISTRIEQVVRGFDEVESTVTKLGRTDLATDAMGTYEGDVYIMMKPREKWKKPDKTKEELVDEMRKELEKLPGVAYNFTQPMAMRLDEVVSGIKADIALKIFGENSDVLERKADQALRILSSIPGATDAQREIVSGFAELRVEIDRQKIARYGLNVMDIRNVVETAVHGRYVDDLIDGQRRFAILLRLPDRYRQDAETLRSVLVQAPGGERIPLGQVANVYETRGPESISRENSQRRIVVQANVRGTDLGTFARTAQARIAKELDLPAGYSIDWGGQFENQERAMQRLSIVVPVAILIIFGLLYASFQSVLQAIMILLNVPFAMVGGIIALWARGLNLNLSGSIGFIALFGVSVLNGIVMISYINRLRDQGYSIDEAVRLGAATRLRPVLMTALVASLGFIPMALATSAGAEVQRPLATVVIGGLGTSTLLTLFVLPTIYPWFSSKGSPTNAQS